MKLSAIVLCYNFEKYIEQSLLSLLLQQTDFDFEVLVRDDFSQDKSAQIIERLSKLYPKLKFVRGEKNIGFAKSYEQLLKLSEGEYIAYLDGDDYLINQSSFQRHVDFLGNNPTYIMTCAGYWEKDGDENYEPPTPVNWLCPRIHDGEFNILTEHYFQMNPSHFNRVNRKNPNTFFDYMYNIPMLDWPLNFELSLRGKIIYLNFPAGVYRKHSTGLMKSFQGKDVGDIIINTIKKRNQIYNKENGK
jgi:glycosyltransferase involved in cell wall biosynthesis